jgi:hypothetical protein
MFSELLAGAVVSLINFGIHAAMTGLIVVATQHTAAVTSHLGIFARLTALLTITTATLLIAHVGEIAVWTGYMKLAGVTIENAALFEFAFENYTALGYGEPTPPPGMRLIGPITSLNGLLLIGWSVAIIFEVMRMADIQIARLDEKDES